MEKYKPISIKNKFYHPATLSGHVAESFLFGTLPSFVKACAARLFAQKHDQTAWISPHIFDGCSHVPRITWIGHATFLIESNGVRILTDPVFGNLSLFFRRMLPPGRSLDQLPRIDYILLSHNHPDHMDASSLIALKKLNPLVQILVPRGDKAWFDRRGFDRVKEFNWWDEYLVPSVRFVFLPAVHWSARGIFDKNKSLWGSWLIQAGHTIYFAGDTAYGPHFSSIAHYEKIETALMPIGPCEPHDWMKRTHVSGSQSVQAFADLGADQFIPMHWGTFPFGYDRFDLPIELLRSAWQSDISLVDKKLSILKVGQAYAHTQNSCDLCLVYQQPTRRQETQTPNIR